MEALPRELEELLQSISDDVTTIIATRLKKVGKLTSEEVSSAANLLRFYSEDFQSIAKVLADKSELAEAEIEKLLTSSARATQNDALQYYKIAKVEPIPFAENKALQAIVRASKAEMLGELMNLSSTSGNIGIMFSGKCMSIREGYIKAINKGVLSVRTGVLDYNTAMQEVIEDMGKGVRVIYPSGRTMRIDSAVRMNILDGTRQMNREIRREEGKQFGADGVYIMPHGLCAKDHLPYQGKEYTYEQWHKLNETLERPIGTGEMNCRHSADDIIVGEGVHPYTAQELKEIDKYSREEVDWSGKKMSRYEASQEQRKAETKIRELKDQLQVAKASGNDLMTTRLKTKIKEKEAQYIAQSKAVGLKPKYARL